MVKATRLDVPCAEFYRLHYDVIVISFCVNMCSLIAKKNVFGLLRRFPKISEIHCPRGSKVTSCTNEWALHAGPSIRFLSLLSIFYNISENIHPISKFLKCKHEERMLLPAVKSHSCELYKM